MVEMAPMRDANGAARRRRRRRGRQPLRRSLRVFRYEMRRWRDGVIPDVGEAVAARSA